jgi:hypothetical protein
VRLRNDICPSLESHKSLLVSKISIDLALYRKDQHSLIYGIDRTHILRDLFRVSEAEPVPFFIRGCYRFVAKMCSSAVQVNACLWHRRGLWFGCSSPLFLFKARFCRTEVFDYQCQEFAALGTWESFRNTWVRYSKVLLKGQLGVTVGNKHCGRIVRCVRSLPCLGTKYSSPNPPWTLRSL